MRALEVSNLSKYYGQLKAVDNISFEVEEGEIFGLIGPNGAGKTTTLRIIATLLRPTSGRVEVFNMDVEKEAEKIRELISYLPEEAGAYKNLRGIDYLKFMAEFYTKNKRDKNEMVERALEVAGLGERIKNKVSTYSKGMVRKLLVARALMHKPKLAILDEPTSGLDVLNSMEVRNIIKSYAREGVTILLSSHNMLEVEFLSTKVALVNKGKTIEAGTPKELKDKYRSENLEEVFTEAMR
ncbi:MAG: ABC transporter ATP-binding protein [Candidatus Aminicenantia bacterium]